MLMREQYKKHV